MPAERPFASVRNVRIRPIKLAVSSLVHGSRDASNSRKREFVRSADGCPPFSVGATPQTPRPLRVRLVQRRIFLVSISYALH